MNIEERIKISLLLERMYANKEYTEKLGLEDRSTLHGQQIYKKEETETC